MDVLEAIRSERAVRVFKDQPLPEEVVRSILNAGRRAHSSWNKQPWQFVAVRERERLSRLSEAGPYSQHLANAALGVLILTPDIAEDLSVLFDAGQAAAYMQLAAWAQGVGSALTILQEEEIVRRVLGIPKAFAIRYALSFGYPEEDGAFEHRPKAGGRKPLEQVVHWEQW